MHSPSLGRQPQPPIPCKSAPKAAARARRRRRRSGNVLVFSVFLMIVLFAFLSLAVDVGYLCVVRTELQRTADVSAIAGAASLYRPWPSLENAQYCMPPNVTTARNQAREFVRHNPAAARTLDVDLNPTNDPSGDIVAGRLPYPVTRLQTLDATSDTPDSVRVRVSLAHDNVNDVARLFFARIWGIESAEMSASATATTWYPALLPFATSEENWDSLATGGAGDCYAYSPGTTNLPVAAGPDGIAEIVMFPGDWTGEDGLPPGNFGIIQIGPDGGELEALRRQVDQGPSVTDMDTHGGALTAHDQVPGRTGLKSSSKHAFLGGTADSREYGGILGRVRQLPLYENVTGNGDNAVFTLARFVAVRVMAIKIDDRWRTQRFDTDGEDITAIRVQPITEVEDLVHVKLTH